MKYTSFLITIFLCFSAFAEPAKNIDQLCKDLVEDILFIHNDIKEVDEAVISGKLDFKAIEKDYMRQVSINVSNAEKFFYLGCKER